MARATTPRPRPPARLPHPPARPPPAPAAAGPRASVHRLPGRPPTPATPSRRTPAPCTAPPAAERRVRPGDLRTDTVPAQDVVPVTVVPDAVRQCVVERPAPVGPALPPRSWCKAPEWPSQQSRDGEGDRAGQSVGKTFGGRAPRARHRARDGDYRVHRRVRGRLRSDRFEGTRRQVRVSDETRARVERLIHQYGYSRLPRGLCPGALPLQQAALACDASSGDVEPVPEDEAAGRVCAGMPTPCLPGIPADPRRAARPGRSGLPAHRHRWGVRSRRRRQHDRPDARVRTRRRRRATGRRSPRSRCRAKARGRRWRRTAPEDP